MNDGVVKERACTSNSISLRGGDDELKLCSEKECVCVCVCFKFSYFVQNTLRKRGRWGGGGGVQR